MPPGPGVPDPSPRIAAVPAGHPYARAVRPPGHVLLPDPPVPGAPPGRWWPPVALQPSWLRANADAFDVLHVHFGTEHGTPEALAGALAVARDLGRPVVHTVHDLEHPHLDDQAAHRERTAVLVDAADALLTLTDVAADEIRRRHGREALVVPHPQLVPDAWFGRADALRRARPAGGPRVAVHVRGLRANVRPGPWLVPLADAVAGLGGTTTVLVNDDVRPGTAAGDALAGLRRAVRGTAVRVVVRPRPDDDALAAELAGVDVSVLPYAHGTHSGWLESCWDLGVRVLTPALGAFADQHREPWAVAAFDPALPGAAADALGRLLHAGPVADAGARLAARHEVLRRNHAAHAAVYAGVLRGAG